MHSIQKKDTARSSIEQRLSAFATESWTPHPISQYDDTYQGEKIKEAANGGLAGGSTSSDEADTDVEKGIRKKVSVEVTRESSMQS